MATLATLEIKTPDAESMTSGTSYVSPQYAGLTGADRRLSASVTAAAPIAPPREWFEMADPDVEPYDVVIEDDGRIHGFPAASWDTCHLSYSEQCVTPPRSATDYAYFKVGMVACADGSRVPTGPLTLRGGHADRTLTAARAMAYYDDTNSAFADVNIGEGARGIWIAGAVRPSTTPEEVRAAMGSGFSGDWRLVGNGHELIALSAVNTPGFRHGANIFERNGMVASMILDIPRVDVADAVDVVEDADAVLASAVQRIASSVGRSTEQRIEMLRRRVHPDKEAC